MASQLRIQLWDEPAVRARRKLQVQHPLAGQIFRIDDSLILKLAQKRIPQVREILRTPTPWGYRNSSIPEIHGPDLAFPIRLESLCRGGILAG